MQLRTRWSGTWEVSIGNLSKTVATCLLSASLLITHMQVSAGSLTVGTKVIYPGGLDQPPKERDTGVSLKAEVVGISDESDVADPTPASATEDLALLAERGGMRTYWNRSKNRKPRNK